MKRKPKATRAAKQLPYEFVLEALERAQPVTKPMFGCTSIYIDDKIVLILRQRKDHPADNGVWLATTPEHHASLQRDFPSMRSIRLFGPGTTGWQVLPEDAPDLEESALKACELVLRGDLRIGKIPQRRLKRRPKATRSR